MSESFIRLGPERPALPVVLSVPHAGRAYSAALLGAARVGHAALESLEDRLVDRLIWRAAALGATALVAQAPRAEIDLNRDEREIDSALIDPRLPAHALIQSPRTRGGLGLIPSRVPGAGAIWSAPIRREELNRRLDEIHRPYHQAVERTLEQARLRFGAAVLLDCHSMPPGSGGAGGAQLVLGDRHGISMSGPLVDLVQHTAEALGYRVSRNEPYAGGYVVARHGRPDRNIHALQLELDRSVYLDARLRLPGQGFDAAAHLLAAVTERMCAAILGQAEPLAAE